MLNGEFLLGGVSSSNAHPPNSRHVINLSGNICYLDELVCWSFTVYLMRIMFPFCNNTKREERFAHVSPAIHSSSSSSIIIYMGDNACNVCVSTYVRFGVLLVDFYTWENGSLSHLGTGDNGHKTCRKMNITQQKH